jgi:hypothetical protein
MTLPRASAAPRMRWARGIALILGLGAVAGSSPSASAQDGPYSNYLVGERSLGLAGAFVAVADDGSAIFHNPAGIASLTTSSASGSLYALARGKRHTENGYRSDLGSADLDYSDPLSLPVFLAGVVKFGTRDVDGVRPHALGAAIFTPFIDERRFVTQLDQPGAVDRLEVRHNDRARWLGIAYAHRPRPGLAFGLSTFYATRSLRHDEVELRARADLPPESMIGSSLSRASTVEADVQHWVIRLGCRLDLTHELRVGAMFQLPGIELGSSAEAERVKTRVGPDPTTIENDSVDSVGGNLVLPWELRLGITWLHYPESLITLDLSLFGPVGDEGDLAPEDRPPSLAEYGAFVPASPHRRAALRGAIGFETVIRKLVPLRGGLFFERSSAPEVLSTSDVYAPDHVDSVGLALSVGIRANGYDFSVGAITVLGWGQGLALVRSADFDAPARYESTDLRDVVFMVFVGGARNVVKQLVDTFAPR